ncbi:DUF2515 domain-containing protein [Robertmurraya korlensis]|uniref:DUF2515 family protein n=1 Tax=Robertmurraya korlensis TaxID=519977 RepID=UPI00203DD4D9|nr:DUF2515 family protein [Robertmurraya korlensis]MCM3599918.1 DUF2515 domain-containing protein [Robertmurraya korlensis]
MNFSSIPFLGILHEKISHWTLPLIRRKEIYSLKEKTKIIEQLNMLSSSPILFTNQKEKDIVAQITKETLMCNKNNITRTQAYYEFFTRNQEVHWSFLAHIVSRNGGYYMTDLKSDYLKDFLSESQLNRYFLFLERSNAFIFQDAFPQLLLYEHSKRIGKPLFHLLSAFHVSTFMQPFWNEFYLKKNSKGITVAMIINEQFMLEERVIKGIYDSTSLLQELPYKLQENLGFTTIFIPYKLSKKYRYRLSGKKVKDFELVKKRVELGKELYQILFEERYISETIRFAHNHPHTGSRSDYWDFLFTKLKNANEKLFSPTLESVWDDVAHKYPNKVDWFQQKVDVLSFFNDLPEVTNYDLTLVALRHYLLYSALDNISES